MLFYDKNTILLLLYFFAGGVGVGALMIAHPRRCVSPIFAFLKTPGGARQWLTAAMSRHDFLDFGDVCDFGDFGDVCDLGDVCDF